MIYFISTLSIDLAIFLGVVTTGAEGIMFIADQK
jgi:hypothetical protein